MSKAVGEQKEANTHVLVWTHVANCDVTVGTGSSPPLMPVHNVASLSLTRD